MARNPWPQPWPDIDTSLSAISDGLAEADLGGVTEGTLVDLTRRLSQIDKVVAVLADVAAQIEEALVSRMETDSIEVPGIGWVQRTPKESETWRHQHSRQDMIRDLANAIAQRYARDPMTGEVIQPLKSLVAQTVSEVADAVSVGNPKQGIRRLNLDPEDYRMKSPAGYKLTLVTSEGATG